MFWKRQTALRQELARQIGFVDGLRNAMAIIASQSGERGMAHYNLVFELRAAQNEAKSDLIQVMRKFTTPCASHNFG